MLFAILGKNPITALDVYFLEPLSDCYSLIEIAVKATPLVMIAVGLALCYIANVWNIGAEGQFLIGAVCGSWIAVKTRAPTPASGCCRRCCSPGAVGGALYAFIPAFCKVRFGASEILTSLMLVYVAESVLDYLVRGPWRDPNGFNFPTTPNSIRWRRCRCCSTQPPASRARPRAHRRHGRRPFCSAAPSWGSRSGWSARRRGRRASPASTLDRLVIVTFLISGALAGLAGIIEVAGPVGHLNPAISPGYGFTAIIVAFLGRLNPSAS